MRATPSDPPVKLWPILRGILAVLGGLFVLLVLSYLMFVWEGRDPPLPHNDRPPVSVETDPAKLPDRALVEEIFEGRFAARDAKGISSHYTDDGVVQDSWGTAKGKDAIFRYYDTQFQYADRISLTVHDYVQDGNRVAITVMAEQDSGEIAIRVPAMVLLEFSERKIVYQREYWDATAYLDGTPILGPLLRSLRFYAVAQR